MTNLEISSPKLWAIICLCAITTACFPVISGDQAFLERFGGYTGKSLKLLLQQFSGRNGYVTERRKLGNGNFEIEIKNPIPRSACRVFYEYNSDNNIVSWYYSGGNDFGGCYVNPN